MKQEKLSMREQVFPIGHYPRREFARLKRQVSAMQRQNVVPPQKMLERLVGLDGWLSKNYPGWESNFPQTQDRINGKTR